MDSFDIDACREELRRLYEDKRGKVSLLPFDTENIADIEDVFVKLELEKEESKSWQDIKRNSNRMMNCFL